MHHAALKRGFNVIKSISPTDANGLIRLRVILDYFKYVTTNTMGSHMLYALYAGCNFSFSGPFYGYDESVALANGNPHKHSINYINYMLFTQSEDYVRSKFHRYFLDHPRMGIKGTEFAKNAIGEEFILQPQNIRKALGWTIEGQVAGYVKGAARRLAHML